MEKVNDIFRSFVPEYLERFSKVNGKMNNLM